MSVMAKIFKEEISEYTYPMSRGSFLRVLVLAAVSGVAVWLLGWAIDRFMMVPIFCAAAPDVAMCANGTALASYIALVLIGMMALPLLIMLGLKRPLVLVVAVTATMWGLSQWTGGVWWLSLLLSVVAMMVTYAAISWINRIRGDAAAILMITLFVLVARFVLTV